MTKIYCKRTAGNHDFYVVVGKNEYYLFSQAFKRSVEKFYGHGVTIDKAINHGIGKRDHAIHHTMDKLKMNIRYLEIYNNIIILKRTMKRNAVAA